MNLDRFVAERSATWAELEKLVERARSKPERLGPAGIRRLGSLYRVAVADLSLGKRDHPGTPAVVRLEELVVKAHGLVHGSLGHEETVRGFFVTRYWRCVREDGRALALSAALLFGPAALTYIWALLDPGGAANLVPASFSTVTQPKAHGAHLGLGVGVRSVFAGTIFTHNIEIAFLAFVGGITFGLLTAFFLVYNGVVLGVVAGLAVGSGNGSVFFQLVLPHGCLELSCITVSGCLGFRVARVLIDPGYLKRSEAFRAVMPKLAEGVLGTALWLVVAGLVEGFITPIGLGVGPALALGIGLAATFWTLVLVMGRDRRQAGLSVEMRPAVSQTGPAVQR